MFQNLVKQYHDSKQRHLLWISPKKLAIANGNRTDPKAQKIRKQVQYRIAMQKQGMAYQPKRQRQDRRKKRQVGS